MQKFKLLSVSEIKEMLTSMKVIPRSIKTFFHVSKWIFLLTVIVNIVAGIIPVISVNILGELINSMTAINLKNTLTVLAVYLAVCFFSNIISSIQSYFFSKFQYQLDYVLLNDLMQKCGDMSLEEFENSEIQDQIQHIQSQIGFRPYSIFTALLTLITSVTTILSSALLIITWNPLAILMIIAPALIFSIFNLSISKREYQTEERNAKKSRSIWYYEFQRINHLKK